MEKSLGGLCETLYNSLMRPAIRALGASFLVPFLSADEGPDELPSRPNIIYLMADDQSTYSIGCYGNKDVKTPEMDRLGNDGMIFDRHYVTTAICMASRANTFTGRYEYKTGCNFVHGDLSPELWEKSYPVLLRKAGYLTAFAGKFGIVVEGKGICEDDFDFYGGGTGQTHFATAKNPTMKKYAKEFPHSTLSYGAFGRDVIRAAAEAEKPFCLSISFKAPHRPTTPDPKFDDIYRGKTFTKPPNYGRRYSKHLSEQSKQGRQYVRHEEWGYDKNYDGVMAVYHQQIYAIDVALGMIRRELKAQGIADKTVIIYTSDNGFICGSHGYGSKVLPMEESSRVPLIIYDPRCENAGKKLRCKQLTGNIDFAPTILELAGLEAVEGMDGVSLLPLLDDPGQEVHSHLALMNTFPPAPTTCMSIVTKDLKYTYWWYEGKGMKPVEELFNLANDPLEFTNLAALSDQAETLEKMRETYDAQLKHWKVELVPGEGYEKYVMRFDRHLLMKEKGVEPPKKPKRKKEKRGKKENSRALK
ncbi:MAG: sulfatase [Akkermansiaceae bacterium]